MPDRQDVLNLLQARGLEEAAFLSSLRQKYRNKPLLSVVKTALYAPDQAGIFSDAYWVFLKRELEALA